jgi:hypothetical protein
MFLASRASAGRPAVRARVCRDDHPAGGLGVGALDEAQEVDSGTLKHVMGLDFNDTLN